MIKCFIFQVFKKLALGDYKWISYNELASLSESFGRGLRLLGQTPGTSIAIYAETRAEWMMSCLGAFSQVSIYIIIAIFLSDYYHIPGNRCIHSERG